MDNDLTLRGNTLNIDSSELLFRFVIDCQQNAKDNDSKIFTSSADIVSAIYYYRKYPDVNEFINKHLNNLQDYFRLQWVRSTWAYLSKLTEAKLSDLVIQYISFVANSEEG